MPIDRASDYRRGKGRIKVATSKGRKGKLAAGDKAGGGAGQMKRRLGEGYGEKSKVAGSAGARLAGKGPNKQWVVKEKGASAIKKKGVMSKASKPMAKKRIGMSKAGNLEHKKLDVKAKSVNAGIKKQGGNMMKPKAKNLGSNFKGAYGGKK